MQGLYLLKEQKKKHPLMAVSDRSGLTSKVVLSCFGAKRRLLVKPGPVFDLVTVSDAIRQDHDPRSSQDAGSTEECLTQSQTQRRH